jgi:polyphosphate kinase
VTVVVELMARFDEEANLNWAASRLEEVGAHVVYGVFGFKTHAKMLMVVRREDKGYRRYIHLGTGNYHPRTTRLYTDFGLLTCNPEIGEDVNEVFKQLTGMGKTGPMKHLWAAPFARCIPTCWRRSVTKARHRQGRTTRPHHCQDELPARTRDCRGALRGFECRGRGRPDRARGLLATARRQGHCRKTSGYVQ